MLKIKRNDPPQLFFDTVENSRAEMLRWADRPVNERRQRRVPLDHDLFRSGPVVNAVAKDFHGRCAFCERVINSEEGIGHFRPLSLRDHNRQAEFADHYSWLAFEWLNLLLLCNRCQKAKASEFPVVGEQRARFLATFEEVRQEEKPLLIDPTSEDPSRHLTYLLSGECLPRKNSRKSKTTIELLRLNDDFLIFERRNAIENVLQILDRSLRSGAPLPAKFLLEGAFLGACREAVARTFINYRPLSISINNGKAMRNHLDDMLANAPDEELVRMATVIDMLRDSDEQRLLESRRSIPDVQHRTPVSYPNAAGPSRRLRANEIASLKISNFRAIDRVQIEFPNMRKEKSGAPCLLLLGENAVGKSTCLSSIALALLGTREVQKLKLPPHELARSVSRTSWNVWSKEPIEVKIQFHHQFNAAEFYYDPNRNYISGTAEQSAIVLGYGPHRYFAPARGKKESSPYERVRSLFDAKRALPDPSEWLKTLSGRRFDEVARTIRTILPTGDDDQLVNHNEWGICVLAQGQLTPVSHLSEGYRSIFAMVTDICRTLLDIWSDLETAQAVVLIDEIETHLHPRWKMRVMSSLRSAFPAVQFIATTHDPLCVRGMDDGEVIVLARDEHGGVQVVEDLPLISGMRAEQILTSEYFGLSSTIDPDVHLEVARLARSVQSEPLIDIGSEARELLSKVTLGDSAAAQIIHTALQRYLRERKASAQSVSPNARSEAVMTVLRALRSSRGS